MGVFPSKNGSTSICSSCRNLVPDLERAAKKRVFVTATTTTNGNDAEEEAAAGGRLRGGVGGGVGSGVVWQSRYWELQFGVRVGEWFFKIWDEQQSQCPSCQLFRASKLTDTSSDVRAFSFLHTSSLGPADFFGSSARGRDLLEWAGRNDQDSAIVAVVPDDFELAVAAGAVARQQQQQRAGGGGGGSGGGGGGGDDDDACPDVFQGRYLICHSIEGREAQLRPPLFAPALVPVSFDPQTAKQWIDFCIDNHPACSQVQRYCSDIDLIDCSTKRIVPGSEAVEEDGMRGVQYVALSYTWGTGVQARKAWGLHSTKLPRMLPKVVRDAMKLTEMLGFRYLWVDKYCIDQDSAEKKHVQIQQMDVIYHNAAVTLIAAAGDNQESGLSGISTPRNPNQLAAILGNVMLVSPLPRIQTIIRQSHWATRGWTYQEAFLSRRRLVFTEEEVYFECDGMCCRESVAMRLDKGHTPDGTTMLPFLPSGMFGVAQLQAEMWRRRTSWVSGVMLDRERTWLMLTTCIKEYTARDLSYESDSLMAFAGVLRQFESVTESPVRHLWGIPYLARPPSENDAAAARRSASSSSADPLTLLVAGLCWRHPQSSGPRVRRRPAFPSWSWCGWSGVIDGYEDPAEFERHVRGVFLALPRGGGGRAKGGGGGGGGDGGGHKPQPQLQRHRHRVSFADFARRPWNRTAEQPRQLTLHGHAILQTSWHVPEEHLATSDRGAVPVRLLGRHASLSLDDPQLTVAEVDENRRLGQLQLVPLGSCPVPETSTSRVFLLVVMREPSGLARRVGSVSMILHVVDVHRVMNLAGHGRLVINIQ